MVDSFECVNMHGPTNPKFHETKWVRARKVEDRPSSKSYVTVFQKICNFTLQIGAFVVEVQVWIKWIHFDIWVCECRALKPFVQECNQIFQNLWAPAWWREAGFIWGFTNIRRQHTKFSRQGDVDPGICSPLPLWHFAKWLVSEWVAVKKNGIIVYYSLVISKCFHIEV